LKQQKRAERDKARTRRRKERRQAWINAKARLAHHMPLWGLPVVAVSLIMGWSGQAGAAAALGMGLFAGGVPVLTEGMVLTFAGLTGQAIDKGRPYKSLMRITWATTVVAAAINGAGHLIEDNSMAGKYRAGAYALASLAAMILWWVVMRSKRAAVSGRTADEIARWKRLGRRHPILMRRARQVADNTGASLPTAWIKVWGRANGAAPGEPSIREIRASRRAAHRRQQAQSWNGKRDLIGRRVTFPVVVPEAKSDAPSGQQSDASQGARTPVQAPFLPVGLLVPGGQGGWVEHRVRVQPMSPTRGIRTHRSETATTRSPQGKDAVSKRAQQDVTGIPVNTLSKTANAQRGVQTPRPDTSPFRPSGRRATPPAITVQLAVRTANFSAARSRPEGPVMSLDQHPDFPADWDLSKVIRGELEVPDDLSGELDDEDIAPGIVVPYEPRYPVLPKTGSAAWSSPPSPRPGDCRPVRKTRWFFTGARAVGFLGWRYVRAHDLQEVIGGMSKAPTGTRSTSSARSAGGSSAGLPASPPG
jgi:hypothetical protein